MAARRRGPTLKAQLIAWAQGLGRDFTLREALEQHIRNGGADPRKRNQSGCDDIKFLTWEPGFVRVKHGPRGGRTTPPTVWRYSASVAAEQERSRVERERQVLLSLWDQV